MCTIYGVTWLAQRPTWVELGPEVLLGHYHAAEAFFAALCRCSPLSAAAGTPAVWGSPATPAAERAAGDRGRNVFV